VKDNTDIHYQLGQLDNRNLVG